MLRMSQDNWISVINTAVTLIASFSIVRWVRPAVPRSDQPAWSPITQAVEKLNASMRWVGHFLVKNPWMILVIGFAENGVPLLLVWRRHPPITLGIVLSLSADVAGLFFTFVMYLLVLILDLLLGILNVQELLNNSLLRRCED